MNALEIEKAYKNAQGEDFMMYVGLCFTSVCSSLGKEATIKKMASIPAGTTLGWVFAEQDFSGGEPNPSPCEQNPSTHKHYLFEC